MSGGTDDQAVDDCAKNSRVGGNGREGVAGALCSFMSEFVRRVDTDARRVPVPVEDVVDDLEQEPDLLGKGAPRWLGAVTPIGGLLFLAGWGVLIWAARGVDPV